MSLKLFNISIPLSCLVSCLILIGCTPTEKLHDENIITPNYGATIYGKVTCDGTPISGVSVSDGVNVVQTNANGVYNIISEKRNGYVFISTPSGYVTPNHGTTTPSSWKSLNKPLDIPERVDFTLYQQPQDKYTMLFLGDIHLTSHKNINNFKATFIPEINKYLTSLPSVPTFGVTLGDMTMEWYWYNEDKIGIEHYISNINEVRGIQIYNTVGNHDNDMSLNSLLEFQQTGEDWECMRPYRNLQGPTCFSYNIGGTHYISLDDVITTNTGSLTDKESRGNMRGITDTDMAWLKQDLSYIPADTPIVVTTHIPLFNSAGNPSSGDANSVNYSVKDITEPFKRFGKVLFISAHTHIIYNTENYDINGLKVTEWNNGALCGNFWNSSLKGINLCTDGSPGGYRIVKVENGKFNSIYKAIGKKENYLFRTYDRNMMNLDISKMNDYTTGNIAGTNKDNWVYINIWDYKPSWTIKVKEDLEGSDKRLEVVQFDSYDPLYMLMYSTRLVATKPQKKRTMFKVKASSPSSTLTIEVTDEFGNSRTEIMTRPKDFTLEQYINEQSDNIN